MGHKRRSLDSRIAFIDNIDTLSAFITEHGIADDVSPRTVLELADQWNHAFSQVRKKGFRFMLYPEIAYTKYRMGSTDTTSEYDQKVEFQHQGLCDLENILAETFGRTSLPMTCRNGNRGDLGKRCRCCDETDQS